MDISASVKYGFKTFPNAKVMRGLSQFYTPTDFYNDSVSRGIAHFENPGSKTQAGVLRNVIRSAVGFMSQQEIKKSVVPKTHWITDHA